MLLQVDGRQVFVHHGGAGSGGGVAGGRGGSVGGTVVLVHGAGNDHSVWRYQTRLLAGRGEQAVAVDLPGHGRSEGPALEDVPAQAAWLLRVMDVLEVADATVVGHSMGSFIALAAAMTAPGRVPRVGLIGTTARMMVHPDLQAAADDRSTTAIDMIVGWSHTGASRFGGHAQAGVWTAAQTRRLNERNLGVLGTDLRACAAFEPDLAALAALGLDALVISGARDRMTLANGAATVADALGATHAVVPEGSHVSLYDHPEAVNAALLPWLLGGRPVRTG